MNNNCIIAKQILINLIYSTALGYSAYITVFRPIPGMSTKLSFFFFCFLIIAGLVFGFLTWDGEEYTVSVFEDVLPPLELYLALSYFEFVSVTIVICSFLSIILSIVCFAVFMKRNVFLLGHSKLKEGIWYVRMIIAGCFLPIIFTVF